MKKILALVLLLPSVAFGQGWQVPYPAGTPRALPTPGTSMQKANVDVYGNALVGLANGGVSSATNAVKTEDTPAASGDAGVAMLGVANTGFASNAANLDYLVPSYTTSGVAMSGIFYDAIGDTREVATREDVATGADAALMKTAVRTNSALAANAATNGDATHVQADELGRTITTLAPAGEMLAACSATNTGTSNIQIIPALASNRFYVTSIACSNNSAVASQITFKDGTGNNYTGWVAANTGQASFTATLPVPLRGSVNTAFNFAMTTTATATNCCASGYYSVNQMLRLRLHQRELIRVYNMSEKKPDSVRFFLQDQEHVNLAGKKVVEKDVLHFQFYKNQKLGDAVDLVCRANDEHIAKFPAEYAKFLNPPVEVVAEPVKELEELKEEVKEEEPKKKKKLFSK